MPRTRTTPPLVIKMGLEVFDRFLPKEKNVFSHEIFIFYFRTVAEKNRGSFIPESYLYHKEATKKEVKRLIKKHNEAEPQEVRREIRVPQLDPGKLKYTINLF